MFSVHSSWPCCQKHPAVQQQCGEDLWFWLGPRCIQRPRLCAQGRCKYSAINKSKFIVNYIKKGHVMNVFPWRRVYHWNGWHLNRSSTKSSPLRVTCGRMEFCSGRSSRLVKTTLFITCHRLFYSEHIPLKYGTIELLTEWKWGTLIRKQEI